VLDQLEQVLLELMLLELCILNAVEQVQKGSSPPCLKSMLSLQWLPWLQFASKHNNLWGFFHQLFTDPSNTTPAREDCDITASKEISRTRNRDEKNYNIRRGEILEPFGAS
jgi:hypothetical protein